MTILQIKYLNVSDADHIFSALRDKYTITTDIECKNYIGITLAWEYINNHGIFSITNYATTAFHKFQHGIPSAPENSPHIHVRPSYGPNIQYARDPDYSHRLQEKYVTIIHNILETFLYYRIAIDNAILPVLSNLASKQSYATKTNAQKITKLLNYLATNPVVKL